MFQLSAILSGPSANQTVMWMLNLLLVNFDIQSIWYNEFLISSEWTSKSSVSSKW